MGTCFRPSWTAMVCPTISGTIVERRDQVRTTFFSPRRFISTTRTIRWSSTNGPFLIDLGTSIHAPPPATDDELARRLVLLARPPFLLPPWRGGVAATGALALPAAERVIHGVHGHSTDRGPLPAPPAASGLAQLNQLVLGVTHDADRRPARRLDQPGLARRQANRGVPALLGHQLHAGPRRASHAGASSRLELQGVQRRPDRDVPKGQGVSGTNVRPLAGDHGVADLETLRRKDVALLAVEIVQQGDPSRPVGVVLDVRHLGRDTVLVSPEVDDPVPALVAAALVPGRHSPVGVSAGLVAPLGHERLLRAVPGDLFEGRTRHPPAAGRRRLVLADGHDYFPVSKISIASPSASLTMARFWSARLPCVNRRRLTFPCRLSVFTENTRTFQICWMASLISVLFARGSTRNVYTLDSRPP